MKIKKMMAAVLALLALGGSIAYAGNVPDNEVFAGAYILSFDTYVTPPGLSGPDTVPGLDAKLDSATTLYLAYIRRLSPSFDIELAFGYPPTTKTVGVGPATVGSVPYNGVELITAKWISPTLLFEYKFLDDSYPLRPYIGVGVNHTIFYDRDVTAGGDAVTGGPTSVSLSPSTGIAGTAGLSYRMQDNWYAHASYSLANIHSRAVTDTDGVIRTAHINFGPRAIVVAIGYAF